MRKGALWTLPYFTVLYITQSESNSNLRQQYYRDGYIELLPPTAHSSFPSWNSNALTRLLICNSELKQMEGADDSMECVTSLSTVQSDHGFSVSPRVGTSDPLQVCYSALLCASVFAVVFPFTILVRFFPFLPFSPPISNPFFVSFSLPRVLVVFSWPLCFCKLSSPYLWRLLNKFVFCEYFCQF